MSEHLPDASWREEPGLRAVLAALGDDPSVTRAVGGAVRDSLLGLPVSDVDLATRLRPDAVVDLLKAAGLKAVPTGIAHGTVTAVADGRGYEVTTLRRDVATDGRRATIAFADDWAEDAARRDFTINAIYADPLAGTLFDPVGGLADLGGRRVAFIGDAGQRIDEDHLRILRWFRFFGRFGTGAPDPATLAVIGGRAAKLRALSRERVADELQRIVALADPVPVLTLMEQTGVLAEIAPEAVEGGVARLSALVAREAAAGLPADPGRRLIALFPPDAGRADQLAARLKLSNRLRKRIALAQGAPVAGSIRAVAYHLGVEAATDRLLLAQDDLAALGELAVWAPPRLPIGGGDLVAMGVAPGPDVARLLHAIEDQWVAEGFPNRARVQALAKAALASRR